MRRDPDLSKQNTRFALSFVTSAMAIFVSGIVMSAACGRDLPSPPKRPQVFPLITETTASIAPPPVVQKPAAPPQKAEGVIPLPIASRDRMSECGREWTEIKRSGKENNRIWREFAMDCLQNQK